MEIWKLYDKNKMNTWEVSSYGRVKKNGIIIQPSLTNSGYLKIKQNTLVHRIVAELFIGISDLPCIDHINNIKTDNRVENLRWISYSDNNKKANSPSSGGKVGGPLNAIKISTCPHCNHTDKFMGMIRHHFDNCKQKQK